MATGLVGGYRVGWVLLPPNPYKLMAWVVSMGTDDNTDKFGASSIGDGDFTTRKIQSNGRLNIPDGYLGYAGVGEGDEIAIVAEDGNIVVRQANAQDLIESFTGSSDD